MTLGGLRIADTLDLPREAVTQTFGILAKRGVGKTYTALVLVEEMLTAGIQVVVADPVGVCWGLRAAADGENPGLPIVILGGDHADVPLQVDAGEVIADLVVDEETLYRFFDERVPAEVVNGASFEVWRKAAERRGAPKVSIEDVRAAMAEQDALNASVRKRMAGATDVEQ